MKYQLTTAFCLCLFLAVHSQPTIQWQKNFGGNYFDEAKKILQTPDGGFVLLGSTASNDGDVMGNHGGFDFWVLKLTYNGEIEWRRTFGGSDNDSPASINLTNDGGYIIAGTTKSNDGNISGNHGDKDGWIIKISKTGALEWQKTLGGSGQDEASCIIQTTDQGYIVAGTSNSTDGDVTSNNGGLDFWIVKLSSLGTIEWQKTLGGSSNDEAKAICQTLDGGFTIIGETASSDGDISNNHGNIDYWVVKVSKLGEIEWQHTFGGIGADIPSDLIITQDNSILITGYTGSSDSGDVTGHHGSFDYWVIKLSSTGVLEWQKALGGSDTDWGRAITTDFDGGYIVLGASASTDGDVSAIAEGPNWWLVKLNPAGDLIWEKSMGGTQADHGFAMDQTSDGSFILAGYAWSEDGDLAGSTIHGYNDFWVVKLAPESVPVKDIPASQPLEIYPNPARHFITLKSPVQEAWLKVIIRDVSGREILRQTISNGEQINVSTLVPGMYQATLSSSSGIKGTGWFQKL